MRYLAFDLGASSGKLFVGRFDGFQLTLETTHRFDNMAIPLKDGLYWDFLYIWRNLCEGIQAAGRGGSVRSIGVDTYCNDYSFIDKSGDLLSPMRCYRDERTIRCGNGIYQKTDPWRLYRETGNQTASFNTYMQLAAMREEGKDAVLAQAHKMLFLPDLIAYYMTGETIAERTIASVSQMYRFDTESWSEYVLGELGIDSGLFGTLASPATISGKATAQFQNAWGTGALDFVSVCEHDTASAFLASPNGKDSAIISSGTWSLVGCESLEPIINEYGFRHNIANEGSVPGHHRMLRNVMGTWILQELRAEYQQDGQNYSFAELEEAAEASAPFAYLIDVDDPAFFSPGNMRRKIRELCQSETGEKPETAGQFSRCICESLALKYRWAIEKLECLTGRKLPTVSIIGGGSKDRLTCRMVANACARPVLAGPSEASAIGNILAQLLAYGDIGNVAEGRDIVLRSFPTDYYSPDNADAWDEVYSRFTNLFNLD
jgi:sugar (pentulose or hexulose) kinase